MIMQPWQLFGMGCICGAFITLLIIILAILRMASVKGVEIKRERVKENVKETDDNE